MTRPHSSAVAASIMSPVSSISSARLRPIERDDRDHRRRAEQTDVHARRREARVIRRDREIARGDELAAGRGRDAAHLGDHRLRDRVQALHQRDAGREQLAVERPSRRSLDHLGDVVAGGERRARSFEHDDARRGIGRDRVERRR